MKTDVIIIGAGPTGLAFALQCIRFGIDFIIIDKKEGTTPYSKAIGVQARTLEIYEQLGLADDLISMGVITEKVRLVEGGQVRGEVFLGEIGKGLSPYPFLLIVEQGLHEKMLYDSIKSGRNDVRWKTELMSFSQNNEGVAAQVRNGDGETESIEAKFLVGCDGSKSTVRHSLGIEFGGSTFERLFYVADVQIDWDFPHDSLYVCLAKNTITAFFLMPGEKRYRIVGTFPENYHGDEGEILYEEIEKQIVADTELKLDITNVNWFSVYKVHSRAVNKFSEGRCFLAGDSAHIHTPAGAQGMNTGIQDGYNLAWKLNSVLKKNADLKLLNSYDEERRENARRLLQTTDRIFQFGASDEPLLAFFRTKIFPYVAGFALNLDVVKNAIFPLVSQIGIHYRHSSLSKGNNGFKIKAGDRMPYFVVDGKSVFDHLREPGFHTIVFTDGTQEFGDSSDVSIFPLYPNVAEIFGTQKTFTVLLRPDNYIGRITSGYSDEMMQEYLRNILGTE